MCSCAQLFFSLLCRLFLMRQQSRFLLHPCMHFGLFLPNFWPSKSSLSRVAHPPISPFQIKASLIYTQGASATTSSVGGLVRFLSITKRKIRLARIQSRFPLLYKFFDAVVYVYDTKKWKEDGEERKQKKKSVYSRLGPFASRFSSRSMCLSVLRGVRSL